MHRRFRRAPGGGGDNGGGERGGDSRGGASGKGGGGSSGYCRAAGRRKRLPVAAKRGRVVAVSVLIAEGANPRARGGRIAVPHYAALLAQGDEGLTPAVEVLRHFIGGCIPPGLASAADIWDVESESGLRPLDVMEEDYAEYNQEEEDGHVPKCARCIR